jgi:hypothetical protein
MAELIKKQRVDDLAHLEGQEIEASETIDFAIDGELYRIDLGPDNAERMRKTFAEFINAAQLVLPKGHSRNRNDRAPEQRKWAAAQGYQVKDRGRIPRAIQDAWKAAVAGS